MLLALLAFLSAAGLGALTIYLLITSPTIRKVSMIAGIFLFLLTSVILVVSPNLPRKCYRKLKSMVNKVDDSDHRQTHNFEGNKCNCRVQSAGLPKDPYSKHRSEAKKLSGNQFILNAHTRSELMSDGDLKRVPQMMGLHIRPLTFSSKDLHKNALPRLEELVRRFNATCEARSIKDGELILSSVTRTEDQQKQVRKKFRNTATSNKSAHSFGAAVDIVGVSSNGSCSQTKKALYDVLRNMRAEGKLLLCPESICIHVTFRK